MDGWNTILSYWVSAYFQGLLLLVLGRVISLVLLASRRKRELAISVTNLNFYLDQPKIFHPQPCFYISRTKKISIPWPGASHGQKNQQLYLAWGVTWETWLQSFFGGRYAGWINLYTFPIRKKRGVYWSKNLFGWIFLLLKVSDEVGGFNKLLFRWFEFSAWILILSSLNIGCSIPSWSPAILTVARISKGMGRKEHLFPWFCVSGRKNVVFPQKRSPEVGGDSGSWWKAQPHYLQQMYQCMWEVGMLERGRVSDSFQVAPPRETPT